MNSLLKTLSIYFVKKNNNNINNYDNYPILENKNPNKIKLESHF